MTREVVDTIAGLSRAKPGVQQNSSTRSQDVLSTDLQCYFNCNEVFKKDYQLFLHLRIKHGWVNWLYVERDPPLQKKKNKKKTANLLECQLTFVLANFYKGYTKKCIFNFLAQKQRLVFSIIFGMRRYLIIQKINERPEGICFFFVSHHASKVMKVSTYILGLFNKSNE